MNIEQMEAGREMDRLVAEKFMNWTEIEWIGDRAIGHPPNDPMKDKQGVPMWSTDIAAAMQVFEELSLLRENVKGDIDGYSRSFYKPGLRLDWYEHDDEACAGIGRCKSIPGGDDGYPTDIFARGNSLPIAICRLALKVAKELGRIA